MKLDLEYFRHALSKRKNDFLSKRAPTLARLSTALTGNSTIYKGQNGNELLVNVEGKIVQINLSQVKE